MPDRLEAGFYRGLALMFSGEYAKAEDRVCGRGAGVAAGSRAQQ